MLKDGTLAWITLGVIIGLIVGQYIGQSSVKRTFHRLNCNRYNCPNYEFKEAYFRCVKDEKVSKKVELAEDQIW